jgi:hypothetical protein
MMPGTNLDAMTPAELEAHIKETDDKHRKRMKHLRALLKIKKDEEKDQQ